MTVNDRRTKIFHKILTGQLLFGFVIVAVAAFLISYAAGYRFEPENLSFAKTGVIYLDSDASGAKTFVNGVDENKKFPFALNYKAGVYNVEIKLDGHQPWQKTLHVEAAGVYSFNNIVLFDSSPVVTTLSDQRKIDQIVTPNDVFVQAAKKKLTYNNNEIWVDDKIVSRFSSNISNVRWYSDLQHVMFQQGDEIRVIDLDGSNDKLLVTLNSDSSSMFTLGNRGSEIYFIDAGSYKMAVIN
ncbi:MAG: PEGA domain-containing protein [Candidatus Berkelbacteria bacterium]